MNCGVKSGETTGASAAYCDARGVYQTTLHQVLGAADYISNVHLTPAAVNSLAVSGGKTTRTTVVHVQVGKTTAGPVLHPKVVGGVCGTGGPAVNINDQRG